MVRKSRTSKPMSNQQQPVTKEDFNQLKDTLDRWRVKVQAQVDDQNKEIKIQRTEWQSQLGEHHKALFGNGKPGMDEEIRNLTTGMSVLIKLGWIVAGSAITMTLSGIVAAAVYIIRSTGP